MNELIKNIPVVALRGMTLLPSMITHFDISREKSVKAVETAMLRDQKLVVVTRNLRKHRILEGRIFIRSVPLSP